MQSEHEMWIWTYCSACGGAPKSSSGGGGDVTNEPIVVVGLVVAAAVVSEAVVEPLTLSVESAVVELLQRCKMVMM